MSLRSATSLRPAVGHAVRSSRWPSSAAQLKLLRNHHMSPRGAPQPTAVLLQCQFKSSYHSTSKSLQEPRKRPVGTGRGGPKPPTVGEILRRGLDFSWAYRSMGRDGFRKLYRDSPEELILAIALLLGIGGIAGYTVYLYFTYFNAPQFTKFPPQIANSLRRALYYTNIKPDSTLALKYYKRALEQCTEHHLDPFSDEVLGIRIQISFWLEKIGNLPNAIGVLTQLADDCLKWVDKFEQAIADGTIDKSGVVVVQVPTQEEAKATGGKADGEKAEEVELENLWRKRSRLLAKAVATNVKLGELYADEHVLEPEKCRERLSWAVETALKELRRRTVEGVKEQEGPWMSAAEIGGALESLGKSYEKNSQFQLALPLFFQALRMCEAPCHLPVLMNNLAISFAQHPPLPVLATPQVGQGQAPDHDASAKPLPREELLQSALNWANNAYTHAKDVTGEARTAECDEACAVALCNLGDISAQLGNAAEARKRFEQCMEMSRAIDFPDGVKKAEAGLKRIETQQTHG